MRVRLPLLASFVLAGGFFGCASILGDFSTTGTSPSDAGPSDGATPLDGAPNTDGAPMGDGGAADGEAGGGIPVLKCDGWQNNQHVVLENLANGDAGVRTFNNGVWIENGGSAGQARVVTQTNGGPSSPNAYWVYTFNPKDINNRTRMDVPLNGYVQDVRRVSDGVGVLAVQNAAGAPVSSLAVWDIADTLGQGMTITPTTLSGPNGIQPDYLSAGFLELSARDFFYALSYRSSQNPDVFTWQIGRPMAQAWSNVGTSSMRVDVSRDLLSDGTNVYAFQGSDPSMGGSQELTFPSSGQATSYTSRAVPGPRIPLFLTGSKATAAGKVNLAFGDVDVNSTTNVFQWRIGQIDAANLATFKVGDLVAGDSYSDVANLPVNNGQARWVNDQMLALGSSPGSTQGMNFVWYDAQGHLRAEQVGAGQVLADRKGIKHASIAMGQTVGLKFQTFLVAWIETQTDAQMNAYDVLYYDELVCH